MTLTAKAATTGRVPRTDEDLLAAVRAQEPHAFRELRDRHRSTALGVALLHTPNGHDAEQLAGTAFDQVLADLEDGRGPDAFLRARLVAVVGRAGEQTPYAAEAVSGAYLGLPPVWQAVLWYLDVEGLEPAQAAGLLGVAPEDIRALRLEARAGLRAAYRRAQLDAPFTPACDEHAGRLGAFVGGGLLPEQASAVREHLDACPRCTAEHLYLRDTDAGLRSWLVPVLAGVSPWGAQAAKVQDLVRIAGHVSAAPAPAVSGRDAVRRMLAAVALSRRGRQVVLGAGALATVAVLAGVTVTGPADLADGASRTGDLSAGAASAEGPGVPSSSSADSSPADRESGPVAGVAGPAETRDTGRTLSLPTSEPSSGPLSESAAAQRRADGPGAFIVTMGRTSTGARDASAGSESAAQDRGRPGAATRERTVLLPRADEDAAGRDGGSGATGRTVLRADEDAAGRDAGSGATGRTVPTSGGEGDRRSTSPSSSGAERPAQRTGSPAPSPVGAVAGAGRPVPSPVASLAGVEITAPRTPAPAAPAPVAPAPEAASPAPSPIASVPGVDLTAPVLAAPAPAAGSPAPSPVASVPSVEIAPTVPATAPPVPAAVPETSLPPHPNKSLHPGDKHLAPGGVDDVVSGAADPVAAG